ncbi:hypothetical protein [Solimonas sp. K1W22B-7]|uniref:hypothetical protein n=1 Tax=Solimonas sp. K1W22B-7 TaxID=2303331 RepID=UPI0013C46433|nr:hypothetical protein [Solimonas sp. K1W22B-7]
MNRITPALAALTLACLPAMSLAQQAGSTEASAAYQFGRAFGMFLFGYIVWRLIKRK